MISRRQLLITRGAGSLTTSFSSPAQPQGKVWRIGFLTTGAASEARHEIFRQALRELGYVEGQNIEIAWRYSAGNADRYREFAAEFIRLKVDCPAAYPGRTSANY